jgi:rhamnosyltransferase
MTNVSAIIVAYNADINKLNTIIVSLSPEAHIIVCDNSDDALRKDSIMALASRYAIDYLPMPSNVGIAAAQNAGILFAKRYSSQFFLLMDDDSIPAPHLVSGLLSGYHKLTSRGMRVGSVGARALDPNGIDVSTVQASCNEFDKCTNMMNSGTLIPACAIDDVGLMDESLFIDCVDFDWGWRAQQKKYELYIVNNVFMEHILGENSFCLFGVRIGVPSPIRHYYQFRNILKMMSRSHVPIRWRIKYIFVLLIKLVIISLFIKPRLFRLYYILLGIRDWALRKEGKLER